MLRSIYSLLIMLVASFGLLSCEDDTESKLSCTAPVECEWDEGIPGGTAEDILENWQQKWEGLGSVPDSFFINKFALQELAISHCGFRAYPGLVTAGDITSMGLVIVAINTNKTDLLSGDNKIMFTNISNPDDPNRDIPQFLPVSIAQAYTRNWRQYNGISVENDTLGSSAYLLGSDSTGIPPTGRYGGDTTQLIPLGLAFAARQVFCTLTVDGNYTDYVIYNCMYELPESEAAGDTVSETVGYRYDLFIRGIEFSESGESTLVDIAQSTENLSDAIDITTPCPFECGDSQVLQGSTN